MNDTQTMNDTQHEELDEVQRSINALNDELEAITYKYLDGPNSVYWFTFAEVAVLDEAEIIERYEDLRHCIWKCVDAEIWGGPGPLYDNFNDDVPDLIVDTIMRVLVRYDTQAIDITAQAWDSYGDDAKETWMDRIGGASVHNRRERALVHLLDGLVRLMQLRKTRQRGRVSI